MSINQFQRDPNIILPRNEFFKLSYDERRYPYELLERKLHHENNNEFHGL